MSVDSVYSGLIGLGGVLLGFLAKEVYGAIKKKSDGTETEIKALTKEIHTLTLSVTELKVEMKHMTDALSLVKEIERDLNKLGSKVRELSTKP